MLATFKTVLFPGHNHVRTTSADDPSLANQSVRPSHWWLAGGYD